MSDTRHSQTARRADIRPREWFGWTSSRKTNQIIISVNGRPRAIFHERSSCVSSGSIALQQYIPGSLVAFSKIEIQELKSENVASTSIDNPDAPADASSFGGNRYKVFTEQLTWHEAQARCV